ncbi:hypothetical protein [Microtetraspora sp. AC03309]|uniref:hypothetical protein n=1 Tax=Microtetraspora sp. AC03309 TaxID=2779376 RepID=UPI001E553C98|nr:hypothetical protein [Microtetraspora sp. AC03309]
MRAFSTSRCEAASGLFSASGERTAEEDSSYLHQAAEVGRDQARRLAAETS